MKTCLFFLCLTYNTSVFSQNIEGTYVSPTNSGFTSVFSISKNYTFKYFISTELSGQCTFKGTWSFKNHYIQFHILSPFNSDIDLIKKDKIEERYSDTIRSLNKIQVIANDTTPLYYGRVFLNNDSIPLRLDESGVCHTSQKIRHIRIKEGGFENPHDFDIQGKKQNFFIIYLYDRQLLPDIYFMPFLEWFVPSSGKILYPIRNGEILNEIKYKKK